MNLLIITFQGDVSGATNSLIYLSKGLAEKGHNVYVGCRVESLLFEQLQNTKVHTIEMKYKRKIDLPFIIHLKKIVLDKNIHIINAQSSWDRYSSIFVRWFFKLPVKVVHTRRQIPMSMGGFFQNFLYYYGTDKIISVSEGVKEELVKLGLPAHHIIVINNGTPKEKYEKLDVSLTKKLRMKYQLKDNIIVIGCVSRLKKQAQILKALQLLEREVVLILVGIDINNEFQKIISTYTESHKVIFTGNISSHEVLNYYKLLDIQILASTSEGLSQSLLESMALEVPVIATAAAGNLDLIQHGENGLLFKDEDILSLANCINQLIEDEDLRIKLIAAGKKTAYEDFSIHKTIDNYETFFENLISENKG